MEKKLNTRIVTIVDVNNINVKHNDGLSSSIKYFPGAKVGDRWLVTTDDTPPYVFGAIVKAELLDDQAAEL